MISSVTIFSLVSGAEDSVTNKSHASYTSRFIRQVCFHCILFLLLRHQLFHLSQVYNLVYLVYVMRSFQNVVSKCEDLVWHLPQSPVSFVTAASVGQITPFIILISTWSPVIHVMLSVRLPTSQLSRGLMKSARISEETFVGVEP